jgi:DNA-binding transcriptional LysR family regulator
MYIWDDKLLAFLTFVESKSLQKAADKLGLTQPAVTHQLQLFEDGFELPIFTISGRKKILTQYGQKIYELLQQQSVDLRHSLEATNRLFFHPTEVTLRVGMRTEVARKFVDALQFEGKLEITPTSGQHALELLEQREIDIAITERTATRPGLKSQDIFSDKTWLILPKNMNLKSKSLLKPADWSFLADAPFLAYRQEPPYLSAFCKKMSLKMKQIKFSLLCEDWQVVISMAESGRGWSLIPSGHPVNENLVQIIEVPEGILERSVFHAYYYPEFLEVPAFKKFFQQIKT